MECAYFRKEQQQQIFLCCRLHPTSNAAHWLPVQKSGGEVERERGLFKYEVDGMKFPWRVYTI